ncbi:four helix bundle protein [Rapidithrix thailandica]|uniref:Four helix bundle protein n=1 Tax=Rapidithrix thailandica TaxID=413964 RepID=A0AAW9S6P8_9BACT
MPEKSSFNEVFRGRTKRMALDIIEVYRKLPQKEEAKLIGRQLLRSATSVAANFRATCRARSKREFFSKLSIVVEEADETLFWLELLEEAKIISTNELTVIKQEVTEILAVMATARKNAK